MELPERFAFGLNDGPPRNVGMREKFFEVFGDRVDSIMVDDTNDPHYAQYLEKWCDDRGVSINFMGRCGLIKNKVQEAVHG